MRRGTTLVEILIAAVILSIAGVAVLGIFSQSTRSIKGTDMRREERFFLQSILSHVNRVSLHELWDHYGPEGAGPPRPLLGSLALVGSDGKLADPTSPTANPLGFTNEFLTELFGAGLKARIDFEFYTRAELNTNGDVPDPEYGLLHMQAGYVTLYLFNMEDGEDPGAPPPQPVDNPRNYAAAWRQPIMCPAIVGRPGLKLSSCPAIAPVTKCRYGPVLAGYEGYEWTQDDIDECNRIYTQQNLDPATGQPLPN